MTLAMSKDLYHAKKRIWKKRKIQQQQQQKRQHTLPTHTRARAQRQHTHCAGCACAKSTTVGSCDASSLRHKIPCTLYTHKCCVGYAVLYIILCILLINIKSSFVYLNWQRLQGIIQSPLRQATPLIAKRILALLKVFILASSNFLCVWPI